MTCSPPRAEDLRFVQPRGLEPNEDSFEDVLVKALTGIVWCDGDVMMALLKAQKQP